MLSTRDIPQCSPLAAYVAQAASIDAAIARVLRGGRYVLGPEVAAFEQEFAHFIGASHGVGVGNGTDAIAIALRALDIGEGDAVITTSLTAVATVVAIRSTGAIPLFADVDDADGLLEPSQVEAVLALADKGRLAVARDRVKAIIPVHLYGRCVDMTRLMVIASRHGLAVVEDCAQAHGACWQGSAAGTFGDFGTFSFYPTKNLGAAGDGGALVTRRDDLLERARLLREYGWRERYISDIEGGNSRLDELQAALLRVKLQVLHADNTARRAIAARYRQGIRHPDVKVSQSPDAGHVYHQFVVRTGGRDALQAWLRERGIGSLVHYPAAVHQQPAYRMGGYQPIPLPHTEGWAGQVVSLPMFPQMPHDDVDYVVDAINSWEADSC